MVLGTNGMLGSMLVRRWSDDTRFALFGGVRRAIAPGLGGKLKATLDGLNAMAFAETEQARFGAFICQNKIDVLVNCIGVIKQRAGGQDPVETVAVNALFPHQIAQIASANGARMIHISTDCVFSGTKGGYSESDTPDALDFYGRSKALGEVGQPHLTLRTSIIGPELSVAEGLGLLAWLLRQKGPTVPGFSRAIFSGVTTLTLADLIAEIITGQPIMTGLFHVASEPIDKFRLLQKINRIFGLGLQVIQNSELMIDRSLDALKIKAFMDYVPPPWESQLRALLDYESAKE